MRTLIVIIILSFVFIKCVDVNATALQEENINLKDSIGKLISLIGVGVDSLKTENDILKVENDVLKADNNRLDNLIVAKDESFDSLMDIWDERATSDTMRAWADRLEIIENNINGDGG